MKKIIALSCFAAVMLAGCGKSQQGSSGTSKATEAATTAEQTTEVTTTAAVTTTEAATEVDITAAAGDRTTMYPKVYEDEIKRLYDELFEHEDGKVKISYTTYDIDADGVPELLLEYDTHFMDEPVESELGIYTVDENCQLQSIGGGGGNPFLCSAADEGKLTLVFKEEDYVSVLYCVLSDIRNPGEFRVGIDDSAEFPIDTDTDIKALLTENGISYLPYVTITGSSDGIKSTVTDPNTGSSEEKDGMFLDFAG